MNNGFKIIGIETRTTNKNQQALTDLGQLWGQFFAEQIAAKIPNKISDDIYAIYTDYESDYQGYYTTIIGIPVEDISEIPVGLVGRAFDAEHFQKFVAKGEMPNAVGIKWNEIWAQDAQLNRTYTYDYEVYGAKSQDGINAEVDIYIAVR